MSEFIQRIKRETKDHLKELDDARAKLAAQLSQIDAEAEEIRTAMASVLAAPDMELPVKPESPRKERKPYVRLPMEKLRDWAARTGRGQFRASQAAAALGVSPKTAQAKLDALVDRNPPVLRRTRNGPTQPIFYEYIPPQENTSGPKEKPNGEPRIAPTEAAAKTTVPHTGRGKGPSGKPGLDKKHAAQGHRVRRERQGT